MKETTTDKFYKASTKLADWGLRVIFIKILGLNKKGPNRRSKWWWKVSLNPTVIMHTSHKPTPIDYRVTISINILETYIQLPMKFQKASIKLVLSVQNSQIHLKKYRDSQAKQKNFTCLHHTNLSSIDYWITMTISTFATSLSSPLNHERNNHRQILQSWHQIGGLRFRVIFVKILGLNKKGPNRRSKWTTTNEIPKN